MSSIYNFGPGSTWSPNATTSYGASAFRSVVTTSTFMTPFRAEGMNVLGELAEAEYSVMLPSGEPAYFHFLLDGSGSTYERVKTGDRRRVYEYLLKNFEHLVEYGDTLQPHDVIYVWTFNRHVRLLCRFERRSLRAHLDDIRAEYKREFDDAPKFYDQTRLYDAIGAVMATIREEYMEHKKADFFLVPFTDGDDNGSETKTLSSMMNDVNSFRGRLHTIFITANMAPTSELCRRLRCQHEVVHLDCESTEPSDITRAFNTLREHIKVWLVIRHERGGYIHTTRVAHYGHDTPNAAERMMHTLQTSLPREASMLDGLISGQVRSWNPIAYH